jgi:WD40 repeat protein
MPIDTNPSVYGDLFFQSLVEGYVTKNKRFLRRDWLAAEIDTHLADPACRFVLLTAEPGFGKSVFMAQLAHDHPNWLRYFIRRDQRAPLADVGSRSFLLRIGYQLAACYPELFDKDAVRLSVEQRISDVVDRGTVVGAEIQKIVASPFHVNISKLVEIHQQVANVAGNIVGLRIGELAIEPHLLDSVALQHMALIEPARAMQRLHPDRQIVILVDALDEIRYHQTEDNILTWLRNCPDLPANVHFVLTARPPAEDVRLFMDKQQSALHKIDLTSQGGEPAAKLRDQALNDVVIYVAALAENAQIKLHLAAQPDGVVGFKQQAVAKADGNIGYLDALARAIDQSLSNQDDKSLAALLAVKSLPDDIQGLYAFFLHQIKVKVGDITVLIEMLATGARDFVPMWSAVYDPFLAVLAVAREPVTLEQIQRLGGITAQWSYLNAAKDNLLQFLDVVGNRYRLYHATLPEFLTDEHIKENSEQQDLYIDAENWHRRIGRFYWQTCHDDWSRCDDYGLAHLPAHLSVASLATELHSLLFGFGWLQAKLDRLGVNALLADFSLPGAECSTAVQDLHTALRQGAHVLGQTPDQLASQMHGRLCDDTSVEIRALLDEAVQVQTQPWLRPMTPSLRESSALLRTLAGHTGGVNGVALSDDGRVAVSASEDGTLKVWDVESGAELRTLAGHTAAVRGVALSEDGRMAVSASADKTLKVWDVKSGAELRTLAGHRGAVNGAALSGDGRLAVSASDDKTLKVWDVVSGKKLRTLRGHKYEVTCTAISRDGRVAVSASEDATLKVWDVENGNRLHTLKGHRVLMGRISGVALSGDNKVAVSASFDWTLRVWDIESGKELRTRTSHRAGVTGVALRPDGKLAVTASQDGTLKVWGFAGDDKVRTLAGHSGWVTGVALSGDGRVVVSASADMTLKVWDVERSQELRTVAGHKDRINGVALSPDGKLGVSASSDRTAKIWDVTNCREMRALSSQGKRINDVYAVASDGAQSALYCRSELTEDVVLSGNGRLVASASHQELKRSYVKEDEVGEIIFWDYLVKLWDVESSVLVRMFAGHTDRVTSVALSEDGKLVVSASKDKTLKLWDAENVRLLRTFLGHSDAVNGVALSRDGKLVVSASTDQTLKVWDGENGQDLFTLAGHTDAINDVALSVDGKLAVSASNDQTLKVWNVVAGKELCALVGHMAGVSSVVVSVDGRFAVSASLDGTLKVWELESGECLVTYVADGPLHCCAAASDIATILTGGITGRVHFLRLERPIVST